MLRLAAVDVHGVRGGDGDHEHGCVGAGGRRGRVGVTRDGLEVGEYGVGFGLAGAGGGAGCYAVVLLEVRREVLVVVERGLGIYLADKVKRDHVTRLRGHAVRCELKLVVRGDGDHHGCCGGGEAVGQRGADDGVEEHDGD